jgi:chromosome segregation ATPase
LPEEINTLGDIALFQSCNADYSEAISLESQLSSLDQSASNTINTVASIKVKLTRFIENIEKVTLEIDKSTSLLLRLSKESSNFQEVLQLDNEAWDTVQNRIEGLPITLSNSIRKNTDYRTLANLVSGIDAVLSKIEDETDGYQDLSNASQINSAISRMVLLKNKYSSYISFSKNLSKVERLIPAFVCVKGSVVSTIPKTGKCAKGSVKTSTA